MGDGQLVARAQSRDAVELRARRSDVSRHGAARGLAFDGLALGFHFGEVIDKGVAWIGVGLIAVFAVRGVVGYLPFWRAAHPGIVFAKLDKLFYSPYCILVAEGFFTLVSDRF